jgi:MoxR-like ATPase
MATELRRNRRRRVATPKGNDRAAEQAATAAEAEVAASYPMPEEQAPATTAERLNGALEQLGEVFAERNEALTCMVIALLTGMNYLLVGPRGTAKTAMAYALMSHVHGARHFSTLLGSFSTMNDLVGRIDLAKLQQGIEERKTEGKLLDCDTAFIDEALKGSDGTLNSLLGLLSDNRDFDGQRTALWSVGSATNWPEVDRRNDRIAALYDRFHIKVPVTAVQTRDARVKVLKASRALETYSPDEGTTVTIDEIRQAAEQVGNMPIADEIIDLLCSVHERCLKEGIDVSDRKLAQWQRALQASAWLAGRDEVSVEDFAVLRFMAWDDGKDIAKADSIIASCDMELVQGLIKRVDEAREEYMKAKNSGLNADSAGKVLDKIIATAEHVSEAMKRLKLRPESKRDVCRAVQSLHKDFEALYSKFQPALEGEG